MGYLNMTKASVRTGSKRMFDAFKREWVECDYQGKIDGIPVPTTGIVRRLRGMAWPTAVKELGIPEELAKEWCEKAPKVRLELFDTRSRYRHIEESGFEDEAALESGAIEYRNLNLPTEMLERLLAIKMKRGYIL